MDNGTLLNKLLAAENAFAEAHATLASLEDELLSEKDRALVDDLHDEAYDAMVRLANRRLNK